MSTPGICVCVCNMSTQPLSHSCSCHSRHKTSIFPHFLRIQAGSGNMFHNQDCCPHCVARKTAGTDSALYHCQFMVWKVCEQGYSQIKLTHPRSRTMWQVTLVPLALPSDDEAGKWEVAGGKSRHLEILSTVHFQLLSPYAAHESEKHL